MAVRPSVVQVMLHSLFCLFECAVNVHYWSGLGIRIVDGKVWVELSSLYKYSTFMEQNIVLMIDIRRSHSRQSPLFFIDVSEDTPRCFLFYCLPSSISLTTLIKLRILQTASIHIQWDPPLNSHMHLNLHVSTGNLRLLAAWGHQSSQGHTFQGYWHDHTHLLTSFFVSCSASLPRNII